MIHIAITAGGTSEPIDGVRKITNKSTGALGWHCLLAVLEYFDKQNRTDVEIYYILTENAVHKPLHNKQQEKIHFIYVSDAKSVYETVDKLTQSVPIDFFIHAMAVSDFTFSYATDINSLANEIFLLTKEKNKNVSVNDIEKILNAPKMVYSEGKKIPSEKKLLMGLAKTQKVISVIKRNNVNTFLVGFKLLKSATEVQLMAAAQKLTETNNCNMVFANDASELSLHEHTGLVIRKGQIIDRPIGKKQIAKSIVYNMFLNKKSD